MDKKKKSTSNNIFIKLDEKDFNDLNLFNLEKYKWMLKEGETNPIFPYLYELNQYQPFGENRWYEIKILNKEQENEFISLFNGVKSNGKILDGTLSPTGEVNGNGSYVQELNSDNMVITKFVKSEDIKSNQKILI